MAGKDITEKLPTNIGNPATSGFWNNTGESYDIAVGGLPFILVPTDQTPYARGTAPYKKDQFDSSKEPGEQSLTGWWIRSQSSFHGGAGIKFFDPSSGETIPYRYVDSQGVNIWTKGQATLLKQLDQGHITTGPLNANNKPQQHLSSIRWTPSGGTLTEGVLLHDEYDVDKIAADGTRTDFINYNLGTDDKVYAICNDGTTAYWVTNDTGPSGKLKVYKKSLDLDATTAGTPMFTSASITVTNAVMEFVKDRIVMCINNEVYEVAPNATTMPTAVYTNPNVNYVYTGISASGSAIYTSGVSGIYSTIQKYTLVTTTGAMPSLSKAIVAAELPAGEIIYRIYYYLGYMAIGTNKGVRMAIISDLTGDVNYGPLIVETSQPCYDFASYDRFVWCAAGVGTDAGVIRIDLSQSIEGEPLRFAYANDLQYSTTEAHKTTSVAFLGTTNRLAIATAANTAGSYITNKALASNVATLTTATAHGLVAGDSVWVDGVDSNFNSTTGPFTVTAVTTNTFSYAKTYAGTIASTAVSGTIAKVVKPGNIYNENASTLVSTGYIQTGSIRFGTLEPKNFKFIRARGEFTNGSMDIYSIEENGDLYNVITYNATSGNPEAATTQPEGSQEYVSFKFTLSRSASDTTTGPTFKGYQIKALPATKRQRLIQFPVWCFDVESDKYKVQSGYEGRAWERILTLETVEANGDIINIQDFRTGERVQGIIENINFTNKTPPNDRYSGFGGVLQITVRTVL